MSKPRGISSGALKWRSWTFEGSKAAMSRKFTKKLSNSVSDFAQHTSAHGIPRASNSTGLRKTLWLMLFFACLGAFVVQAYQIIKRFSRNDIIVGVELKFENIHFPSVTVCNLNPYKNSLARMLGSVRDTLIAFDDAIEKSDQNKRTKRSLDSYDDDSPHTVIETTCTVHKDTFTASRYGNMECVCRYLSDMQLPFECSARSSWSLYSHCSTCSSSGLCSVHDDAVAAKELCHCTKDTCIKADHNIISVAWPLVATERLCKCRDDICVSDESGDSSCTCVGLYSSKADVCERTYDWSVTKCYECFAGGTCVHHPQGQVDCICNSLNMCFEVANINIRRQKRGTELQSVNNAIKYKRQIKKLYEKIYSSYEGLLAVYSMCQCEGSNCKALKSTNQGEVCLCFYNKKNSQIWPCYPPQMWSERRCNKCSPLGDCVYTDSTDGQLPCVCASVIRMCVRIEERTPEEEVITKDETSEVVEDSNSTSSLVLGNRIPKIWEFTTTTTEALPEEDVSDKEMAYGLKGIEDPVAIRATAVENLIFAVNELNQSEIGKIGYDKGEFITKCSFNGRQCSIEDDFSVYIDPSFGNCFTFNYNTSKMIRSERAGSNYGLRFQVFVNITDYLPTTEAAGVRITVHSPTEQPFPDTHGYSAPTGFVSSFAIRLKSINRLPMPYGQCVKDGKDEDYIFQDKEYSTEGCQRTCIQKYLVQKCGCGDPRFPAYQNHSNCPVAVSSLRDCLRAEMKNAARLDTCICQQPCNQEVYTVSYSCARWPSGQSAGTSQECGPLLTPQQCLHFHREQAALIEVYFEQLNYESLKESEAYGFPNLLSDFGGQLGLWMGVSVITIMEVCILMTEIVVGFFSSLCCCTTKRKSPPPQNHSVHLNGRAIPYIDQCPTKSYDVIRSFK
ncbi:unnamed protein product [Bursaphelenchus okinawaensis]|uniref:Uncharacterized protein n=1 Tax=Bursaphelenchus okinawaensis TaxID=465554 RepID=A0A811JTR8_9BILA|nr:unnamed protein product [Bursaphelenchus okinawaensis]CAG9082096.1 unnamed protein product [Bursaphelenchus okinawaensis]